MLVIRMQRTGRKGHAQFRVVVQDSRRTPASGRVVAALGHFNPHTKETSLNKEKITYYLDHGAQPSDRVVRLLRAEGIKLPNWVRFPGEKKRAIRNTDKLRKNRPTEDTQVPPEVSTVIDDTSATSVDESGDATSQAMPEEVSDEAGATEGAAEEAEKKEA